MSSVTRHHDVVRARRGQQRQHRVEVLGSSSPRGPGPASPGRPWRGPPPRSSTHGRSGCPRPRRRSGRGPARAGAWPSTTRSCGQGRLELLQHLGSPARTAGTSITSASPRTRGRVSSARDLGGPEHGPGVLPAVAGTHDEAMKKRSSGRPSLAAGSMSMPARPGRCRPRASRRSRRSSPCGTISRASSAGISSVLSRCMCASIRPGRTTRPASRDRLARPPLMAGPRRRSGRRRSTTSAGSTLPGEDIDDLPAGQEQVGGLQAPSHADPSLEEIQVARCM